MRRLSFISILVAASFSLMAQSPHGENLLLECSDCHTTEGWKVLRTMIRFNHDTTNFVLEGQHRESDCRACHQDLKFPGTPTSCNSCHTDIHENTLGLSCNRCHNSQSWIIPNARPLHENSRFPLLGAHGAADCSACHQSSSTLRFEPLGVECIDCHREHYLATTEPNHQELDYSINCIECHNLSAVSWTGADFEHGFFALDAGHAIECKDCHKEGSYVKLSNECFSCHVEDYNSSTNPNHSQLALSDDCAECHTTNPGWNPANYTEHDSRFFPIYSGEHNNEWSLCSDCHTQSNTYSSFSCIDCHEHNKFSMDREHDDENGYLYESTACFECHPLGDKEGSFNHAQTNFPLKGEHTHTACSDCHTNGYVGTSTFCNACHLEDYDQAQEPQHSQAGISDECLDCHDEEGWKPSTFSHSATDFELTGGHTRVIQCSDCHKGSTINTVSDCIACHQLQYDEAPDHTILSFPQDCSQCHSSENWEETFFDHDKTDYPLVGNHISADCSACHTNGFTGTSKLCNDCHNDVYATASEPKHAEAGIQVQCEDCHTPVGWSPSEFDHLTTGFELSGAHVAIIQCSDCHKGTLVSAEPTCISCHQVQYDNAPNHIAQAYPLDCAICHNSSAWDQTTFDHNQTDFPLVGQHSLAECAGCHTNGYTGTSTLCNDCHNDVYTSANEPSHSDAGIPTDCEDCHTPAGWSPSEFDHLTTGFELSGAHVAIIQCSDCHKGTLVSAEPTCISCHQVQYDNAPNHAAQAYPLDCAICHNSSAWDQTTFDHNQTDFPLVGQHSLAECAGCHTNGYTGTSTLCNDCHNDVYTSANEPSHSDAGIPTDCEDCHTPAGWSPSEFDHLTTGFELSGAHVAIIQCSDCHKGTLVSAEPTCISCHQVQYNNANDPPHLTGNFPTTCEDCHTSSAWTPSTFDHDGDHFPIYTGEHQGEWNNCNECHTVSSNYQVFSCIDCHEHNRSDMDDEHRDEADYQYESNACYACHPDGKDI